MKRDEDGKTQTHRYSSPEDPSAWFIFEGEVYMHCHGVYGWSSLKNHSIEPNGEVNASVLSTDGVGGQYHEFVVFDDWPTNMRKNAGAIKPQAV